MRDPAAPQGDISVNLIQYGRNFNMDRVLEGVKVVELSQFASCPASGRMLADMGADVIKVEG